MAKPEFDDSKPFESVKPEFDPSQPFEAGDSSAYSKLQSALMGGINQFNAAPAIGAAVAHPVEAFQGAANPVISMVDKLSSLLTGQSELMDKSKVVAPAYNATREALQKEFKQAESDNPWSYMGGNVVGGLALAPVLPGVGAAAKGANLAKEGAKLGAVYGGLGGLGTGLSEGKDVSGVAKSVGLGTAVGAGTGYLGGALVNKLRPSELEASAAKNVVDSLKGTQSQVGRLAEAPIAQDVVDEAGKVLYKAPAGKNYLEQAGTVLGKELPIQGREGRLETVRKLAEKSGEALEATKQSIAASGAKLEKPGDIYQYIDELGSQFLNPLGQPHTEHAPLVRFLESVKQNLMPYLGSREAPADMGAAMKALSNYIKPLGYEGGMAKEGVEAELARQIYGKLNDSIENGVANQLAPEALQSFMKAKEMYRAAASVLPAAKRAVNQELVNRSPGVLGHAKAAIGHSVAGLPGLVTGVAADSVSATGMGQLAVAKAQMGLAKVERKADEFIGKTLTSITPENFQALGTKFAASSSPTAQTLGRIFSEAATKDQVGRNALMFSLLQNKTYRHLLSGVGTTPQE